MQGGKSFVRHHKWEQFTRYLDLSKAPRGVCG
jgi:hypothetical protein